MSEKSLIAVGLVLLLLLATFCAFHHGTEPAAVVPQGASVAQPAPTIAASPVVVAPTLQARAVWSGESLTLTGTVPSAELKAGIVKAAETAHGADRVVDQLSVVSANAAAPSAALVAAAAAFPPNLKALIRGSATLENSKVSVEGVVESAAIEASEKARWAQLATKQYAGMAFSTRLSVVEAPKTKEDLQARLNRELALQIVEFRSGSAVLTPQGVAILNRVAPLLAALPNLPIAVQGHTDNQGGAQANQKLSEARAAATKAYLITKGIVAERMAPSGFGATKPVTGNDTPEGRQRNRRIEFVL